MAARARSLPGRRIRRVWGINPITRVHDNDTRKDAKKERQAIKRRLAEEMRDDRRPFAFLANRRPGEIGDMWRISRGAVKNLISRGAQFCRPGYDNAIVIE